MPCAASPAIPRADEWGLRRKTVDYGAGAYDEFDNHPLATATTVAEIEAYPLRGTGGSQ